jgi:hypothetical protein
LGLDALELCPVRKSRRVPARSVLLQADRAVIAVDETETHLFEQSFAVSGRNELCVAVHRSQPDFVI